MDIERASASANQLYRMVVQGEIRPDPAERQRLPPLHLAHLAITGKICLSQEDKDRIPVDLLLELIAEGVTEAGERELARLQPSQLAFLSMLEAGTDGADAESAPLEICS